MKIRAYAKVNLALDVVGKREDGYHELEMIMAPITLHDLLYINRIDEGIEIESNSQLLPTDERNIMYKAAKLLIERYHIPSGVHIHIYKHIPMQAGLAGGSADGAAVLKAMNKMFHLHLSDDELAAIGKELGADIPFCIYEQTALVKGIGEKLEFIPQHLDCHLLLVKPKRGVSTKKSFARLDFDHAEHPDIQRMKKGIENDCYEDVIESLGNTLEGPSLQMVKEIQEIKDEMLAFGFDGALMSGSGSCVFGITRDEELLKKANDHFREKYRFVRMTQIYQKEDETY